MAQVVAVVPLYKTGHDLPCTVSNAVIASIVSPTVLILDLFELGGADSLYELQSTIDWLASDGPELVAESLIALSTSGRIRIASDVDTDLVGRPDMITALVRLAHEFVALGGDAVITLPWWVIPGIDASDVLFHAIVTDPEIVTVGVISASGPAFDLAATAALELGRLTRGTAVYVVQVPDDEVSDGRWPSPLLDSGQVLVLPMESMLARGDSLEVGPGAIMLTPGPGSGG